MSHIPGFTGDPGVGSQHPSCTFPVQGIILTTAMRTRRGFTLIELAVVVAIIAILAALVIGMSYKGSRNANVDAASNDLVIRLAGLPGYALTDGQDRVLVFVDKTSAGGAPRTFVLTNPPTTWVLSSFNPGSPGLSFTEVDLPDHARLLSIAEAAAPSPYGVVKLYDSRMLATCAGTNCFAIRFGADGEVRGEAPAGGDSGASGFGFVVGDDQDTATNPSAGSRRRGIVVAFPTGAVKSYVP